MLNNTMNTQDAVSANFAECFVTLNGTRYGYDPHKLHPG